MRRKKYFKLQSKELTYDRKYLRYNIYWTMFAKCLGPYQYPEGS